MPSLRRTLLSFAIPLLLGLTAVAAASGDLEEAAARFRSASSSKDKGERTAALAALVATANVNAVPVLAGEFGRAESEVRQARDDLYRARYQHDRVQDLIATMELRAERDKSLGSSLTRQREKSRKLSEEMDKAKRKIKKEEPWRDELGEGAQALFASFDSGKRKKAEKAVWESLEDDTESQARMSSVALLGRVGGPGTALSLQKLIDELLGSRSKSVREQRKAEADVRKFEKRMQEEQRKNEGRLSGSTQEQYARLIADSARLIEMTTADAHLIDVAVEAGGFALAREEGKALDKSLSSLLRAVKKAEPGGAAKLLRMLGGAKTEPVREKLRTFLDAARDPLAQATAITALASAGDTSSIEALSTTWLSGETWLVRSAAADALATLRMKAGVAPMIDRLAIEEHGRVRTDISNALVRLTGKDFRTRAELWQRWWKKEGAAFEVPAKDEELSIEEGASEEAKDTVGVTFFGIRTTSQRILFVFDLSGSMNFAMVPRDNPDDNPEIPFDMPKDGEISRLEAAKTDLSKAMGGLREGARFNIVFYASDVWAWQDNLVDMDEDSRTEALEMIDGLEANGGTNIYGALKTAFELADVKADNDWAAPEIDTIFLLTDGRASIGVTNDPDEILSYVRELNASAGITIHTIGLSGAQDAYLLRSLAEQNGGDYAAR